MPLLGHMGSTLGHADNSLYRLRFSLPLPSPLSFPKAPDAATDDARAIRRHFAITTLPPFRRMPLHLSLHDDGSQEARQRHHAIISRHRPTIF